MTAVAIHATSETSSLLRRVLAAGLVSSFILVWLASLVSPILWLLTLLYGYYTATAALTGTILAAYLPWEKGPLFRAIGGVYSKYHPYHYRETILQFEDALPSTDDPQTFYAVHPHGAFSMGWSILFCHPGLQHVRFCFSPVLLISPFFRLFCRVTGNPGSASKKAMTEYLAQKESLALPPGGFEEATLTCTTQDRAYIKKRTGFIKLCLQQGVQVRPVYVLGENSLVWNLQGFWKLRLALNRMGLPAILVFGWWLVPLLPRPDNKLIVAVGKPLVLPKIENPTKDQVKVWHEKYMAALQTLYDEHKEEAYGPQGKTRKLELW